MKIHVVSMARSGSTYLATTVAAYNVKKNERSVYLDEPLNDIIYENAIENFLKTVTTVKSITMKDHMDFYVKFKTTDMYNEYSKIKIYKIGLLRKDIFESSLSHAISLQTQEWHRFTYTNPFIVNMDTFMMCLQEQIKSWEKYVTNIDNFNEILYYEDLTGDPVIDFNNLKIHNQRTFSAMPLDDDMLFITNRSPDKQYMTINYNELRDSAATYLDKFTNPLIKRTGFLFELCN